MLKRRIIAIQVALLMAFGIALTGFIGLTASAEADTIGIGSSNSTVVTFTDGVGTATVDSSVLEGQYFLYFELTEPQLSEDEYYNVFIGLSWGTGEETYSEYLGYSPELGKFYAMLTDIKGGDEITFTSYSQYTNIVGNVYLDKLSIGAFNDYTLGNVNLPASVELNLTAGEYIIAVSPYIYGEVEGFDPTYTVEIGGTTYTLEADPDLSYTYTGVISVNGEESVMANFAGENAGDYAVEIRIYDRRYPTALPATDFEMVFGEEYLFSYTPTETGFMQMHATAKAETGVEYVVFAWASVRTETSIASRYYPVFDYPVYMVAGTTYYFEVSYSGADAPDSLTADIDFEPWVAPTVERGIVFYIPTDEPIAIDFSGNYDISVAIAPDDFDFATETVTLHLDGEDYTLNAENDFICSVDLTGVTSMSVSWRENEVFGMLVDYTPITGEIAVDTAQSITMPAGRDGRYTVTGLDANTAYEVILSGITGETHIEVSGSSGVIVEEGKLQGVFAASEWEVGYFFLDIFNYGEDEVTFDILVREAGIGTLTFDEASPVVIAGYSTSVYTVVLSEGDYVLHIENGANINVRAMDATVSYYSTNDTDGFLSVYIYGDEENPAPETTTVTLFFDNTSSENIDTNVIISTYEGALVLDEENNTTVTLNPETHYVAYSIALPAGNYYIDFARENVEVIVGGVVIGDFETFTVTVGEDEEYGEVILLFRYTVTETTTITVNITRA